MGDYKASFAPSWIDLDRADPSVFQLSARLKNVLTAHYPPEEFGFVIYKPDHGGAMHPLAYRHSIRSGDLLFIPTRHEHGHDGPPDWDHFIYHQGDTGRTASTLEDTSPGSAGDAFESAKQQGKPVPAEIDMSAPLRKLERKGLFPNEDIEIRPAAASVIPGVVGALAAG